MPAREEMSWRAALLRAVLFVALVLITVAGATAQDLEDAQKQFRTGHYGECVKACEQAATAMSLDEQWPLLHAQALLAIGQYPQAEAVISNGLARMPSSIRLRWQGDETASFTGQPELAEVRVREISELVRSRTWAYREPADVVTLGRMALHFGADPKVVLERLFDAAQKADPNFRDVYLAGGELALEKHDFAIAASKFGDALKRFPDDADVLCGLARAYQPNARGKMLELLDTALEKNENHVPSLLLLVDHTIDAEEYTKADEFLTRALKVNPWHPQAWAYRAVLAHLRNQPSAETQAREKALKFWRTNPGVDHLIGFKLSQNYRFAEGAEHQRQALSFDAQFVPAKIQLAQDLLRLGDSDGWKLVEEVHKRDGYDVTAYNLATLRATMQKFQTITNGDFVLRMAANEAPLYGDRAMALLQKAKTALTSRYGVTLESPTFVEIFPEQKDFAVRTFGMPGNPGFLGVCFGRVVTANSPASQGGNPANWEAVLWHEFTHVVTLQLTKNKMPRWLSEGISVYEEMQKNPTWGQTMNPRYREMVLGDDLKPVGELSSAFISPKSDLHVQFAYYESALVVEFLVGKFGFEKLKAILRDLGNGVEVNEAISKHTAPMKQIEKEFTVFARGKAEALGPGLDWEKPASKTGLVRRLGSGRMPLPRDVDKSVTNAESLSQPGEHRTNDFNEASAPPPAKPVVSPRPAETAVKSSPKPNYWKLMEEAAKSVSEKQWQAAKSPLKTVIELYPDQSGPNNAYALLVTVHHALNQTNDEHLALEKWASLDADALEAYFRLMEICEAAKEWKAVALNAERSLAVNPLLPQPYRFLGRASEELGETNHAVAAYQKLLLLDPADPADVHFRLARLLRETNASAAKRHVLQALEDAPRFREAQRLLLELTRVDTPSTNAPVPQSP